MVFTCFSYSLNARHITGGDMSYTYMGTSGGKNHYIVTLKLYRDCYSSGAQLDPVVQFGVFSNGPGFPFVENISVDQARVDRQELRSPGPCITNPPVVCYEIGYYTTPVSVPSNAEGYTIAFQRCCRVGGIENVFNSSNIGATYIATIPGTSRLADAPINNSAHFTGKDTVAICANTFFRYDFSAVDPDTSDSLVYEFCDAYIGGSMNSPAPSVPDAPPYTSVPYAPPFYGNSPMGFEVSINRHTGIVSGIAPSAGIYVLTVCVSEYRRGQLINISRKDLQVAAAGCLTTDASLEQEYMKCDDYTLTISNKNRSPMINSQSWDFGDPHTNTDVSTLPNPSYTYSDTGVYTIRLITNPGQDCSDTTYATVRVFPGFKPGFRFIESCANVPIPFEDTTTARFGFVNFRSWDFGEPQTLADTGSAARINYTYPNIGTRNVTFIVGTSKGCRDTIVSPVAILAKPPLTVTNDTLICIIDTLQLNATGIGTITWTPAYNISTTSGAAPLVSPDRPTTYYVHLQTVPGCENFDSVFVDVRSYVTINAGRDMPICQTDSFTLSPSGDALAYTWTPANLLNNNKLKNARGAPITTTRFLVTGTIGKCSATDEVNITVVPYPQAFAGPDLTICYDSSTRISARINGAYFQWSPANTLKDAHTLTPLATPKGTTKYILTVTDTLGCPKPTSDTTMVIVMDKVLANAGRDTMVIVQQPLQLRASGGEDFVWSPPTGLNSAFTPNPLAHLNESITYIVKVSTPEGCYNYDTINIKVFNSQPDIFVPNAFTPNNDGHNDYLYPIPVGITQLDYFRVYNRWGQLVYNSTSTETGWNGKINGEWQGNDTFVWMAQGTDFKGTRIFKKGTVVLIR